MLLLDKGEGELRFGPDRYPLKPMDVVACPTGGAEVAHQIVNTGPATLRYLAVSTLAPVEVCAYPDSGKIGVYADTGGRHIFHASDSADYYDGEPP